MDICKVEQLQLSITPYCNDQRLTHVTTTVFISIIRVRGKCRCPRFIIHIVITIAYAFRFNELYIRALSHKGIWTLPIRKQIRLTEERKYYFHSSMSLIWIPTDCLCSLDVYLCGWEFSSSFHFQYINAWRNSFKAYLATFALGHFASGKRV